MERIHHRSLLDSQKLAIGHGSRGSDAESLACERAFPKEASLAQHGDSGLFTDLGHDGEPDFAFLDIENSVSRIALCKDPMLFGNGHALPALANGCQEGIGVELALRLRRSRIH
jgi:hypothetical protein